MNAVPMRLSRYFAPGGPLRFQPKLEGMRSHEGVVYIGDRAGPDCSLSNLAHELAHFSEIDDARMLDYGWGLIVPQVTIGWQTCNNPQTMKATERELRVMAYQSHLLESIGFRFTVRELVRVLKYMPDFCYVPLEDGRMAHDADDVPYEKHDASRIRWMVSRVNDLRQEFTFDRFLREWERKVSLLS